MMAERELVCDEYALSRGANPSDYAEGILHVCRFYFQAPGCVAGISGANLNARVMTIADGAFGRVMGLRMRSLLGSLIALCLVLPFAVGALGAGGSGGHFQSNRSQGAAISYGVASIRPSAPAERGSGVRPGPGGGLRLVNDTALFMISWAYNVQAYQVVGAPAWASSKRYDVTFTASGKVTKDSSHQLDATQKRIFDNGRVRLQQILHDRFGLALHPEKRIMPVYTLESEKPRLKASGESTQLERDKPGHITAAGAPMSLLAQFLSLILGRPVNDATGLKGFYDFQLSYDPASVSMRASSEPDLPSIFTAIHDQLGLKLVSTKGPVSIFVIDKLGQPTAN